MQCGWTHGQTASRYWDTCDIVILPHAPSLNTGAMTRRIFTPTSIFKWHHAETHPAVLIPALTGSVALPQY